MCVWWETNWIAPCDPKPSFTVVDMKWMQNFYHKIRCLYYYKWNAVMNLVPSFLSTSAWFFSSYSSLLSHCEVWSVRIHSIQWNQLIIYLFRTFDSHWMMNWTNNNNSSFSVKYFTVFYCALCLSVLIMTDFAW